MNTTKNTKNNMISKAILVILTLVLALATAPTSHATSVLNLTSYGSSGMINGAKFQQFSPGATGTGLIDSFVRIQNVGTEKGYNTDGALQYNTMGGAFTHSIHVSDAAQVTISGVSYREFLLDINQISCPPGNYLSLDALEVYTASAGNLTGYPNLGSKVYSLDSAFVDNSVKMDYNLNAGSGQGDVLFYLPSTLFADASKYLYLYSQFGVLNAANDGFEEWAVRSTQSTIVPEPMTWVLMIMGLGFAVILKTYRPTASNQA